MRAKLLAFVVVGLLTSAAAASIVRLPATHLTGTGGAAANELYGLVPFLGCCPDGDCCPCPDGCPDCCDDPGCCGVTGAAAPAKAHSQACPHCGDSSCPMKK